MDGAEGLGGIGKRGGSCRDRARTARLRLPNPALEDAHMHVPLPQRGHQLKIHPAGKEGLVVDRRREFLGGQSFRFQAWDDGREVRVTHIHPEAGVGLTAHGRGRYSGHARGAHLHGDARGGSVTGMHRHLLGTRPSADGECVLAHQVVRAQPVGKDAGAIAAHFRHGPIGVAVIHKPVGGIHPVRKCRQLARVHEGAGAHNAQ